MALIDDVFRVVNKLRGTGWEELLDRVAGVKLEQADPAALKAELLRPLEHVDRNVPGFADFAADGNQAITPGRPAQSLLYHADITRVMEPNPGRNSGTVAPLTDEEIGQVGNLPWDGVPGPVVVSEGSRQFVDYANFRHVDYVRSALDRKFTMRLLARVDAREYKQRTLAAALGFIFLGGKKPDDPSPPDKFLTEVRLNWRMLSFRKVNPGNLDLESARSRQLGSLLTGDVYRMECFTARSAPEVQDPNFFRVRIEVDQRRAMFVAPSTLEVIPT